ncbi:MAG: hypothetical protein ACE5IB_04310 [Candidatus Geothermarchaeales archaeon]
MKFDRVVGYVVLSVGLGMVFSSVFLLFSVFTGASDPPRLFEFSDVSFPIPQPEGGSETVEILSGEDASRMAAMGFWYMLMFFVMLAGGRVASSGVNLIREIRVELKQ